MRGNLRRHLWPLVIAMLASACAVSTSTPDVVPTAPSLSSSAPSPSSTRPSPSGMTFAFHASRQLLFDQLTADGYACADLVDESGGSFAHCTYAGGDATEGITAAGTADDLGAVSLVTDEQRQLTGFLGYAGSDITEWVQGQLSTVPDDGIDACRTFSQAVVYLRTGASGGAGGATMVTVILTAVDWPALRCSYTPLAAGEHISSLFRLQINLTVDDGWLAENASSEIDWMVVLLRDHGALRIERYGGEVVADRCATPVTRALLPTADALVSWLSAYPGLHVQEQPRITIGGFPARVLDVEAREIPKCANEKNALVPLWVPDVTDDGVDPVEGAESLAEGDMMRVILVEHPDGPLILTVVAGDRTSSSATQHLIDLSEPVIQSMTFAT